MLPKQDFLGRQGMKPIYGQVIQSAPTWSGPLDRPYLRTEPTIVEKRPNVWGQLLGTVGEGIVGGLCLGFMGEASIVGAAACPVAGGLANAGIQKLFN